MDTREMQTLMTVGRKVICNGYPGTVVEVYTGQLLGMVNVRLDSGVACVSILELTVDNTDAV